LLFKASGVILKASSKVSKIYLGNFLKKVQSSVRSIRTSRLKWSASTRKRMPTVLLLLRVSLTSFRSWTKNWSLFRRVWISSLRASVHSSLVSISCQMMIFLKLLVRLRTLKPF